MMFNLLHADLYRLIRSRKFWIVTALVILLTAGTLTALLLLRTATGAAPTDADGISVAASASAGSAVSARMMDSHTAMLSGSGMGGSSIIAMLIALLAVLVVMDDWDAGFVKNLIAGRHGRTTYDASRLLLSALTAVWNVAVAIASMELAGLALGIRFLRAEDTGVYLAFCGMKTLGVATLVLIVVALTMIVRSKAFGVAAAVLVGGGIMRSLANIVLSVTATYAPWTEHVARWLPSTNAQLYADGAGLFATADGMPVWAHSLICFAGWIVLSVAAVLLIDRRRDVC